MDEELFEIISDEIVVEVTDRNSGKTFRRELPVDYYENSNFLRLRGENFDGSTSELVFLTARGLERYNDISGKGADKDNC